MNDNQKPNRWWKHTMHPEMEALVVIFSVVIAYGVDFALIALGLLESYTVHAYIWTFVPVYAVAWIVARVIAYRSRGW